MSVALLNVLGVGVGFGWFGGFPSWLFSLGLVVICFDG